MMMLMLSNNTSCTDAPELLRSQTLEIDSRPMRRALSTSFDLRIRSHTSPHSGLYGLGDVTQDRTHTHYCCSTTSIA